MDLKLKEPIPKVPPEYGARSSQVYRWPVSISRMNGLLPVLSTILLFMSLYAIRTGIPLSDFSMVSLGMVGVVISALTIAVLVVLHFATAREVRFTRDCLIIRQTGRRELYLPYCRYQHEWVVDLSNECSMRLIVFGSNRSCSIIYPPFWMIRALQEISRIQQSEGWYEPEYESDHGKAVSETMGETGNVQL